MTGMPVAELNLPSRLLAGGGPGSPDPRVLRALTTPVIGQFDPDFTAIMDDVMDLARRTFLTQNPRCFPVSGLAPAGLEAIFNTLIEPGDSVAIGGGPRFVAETAEMARRYGAEIRPPDKLGQGTKFLIVPHVDPGLGRSMPVRDLALACRTQGVKLVVEATFGLGGVELRVDDWGIDACVAGVDYCLGAPSGMALVTYSSGVEATMHARTTPPKTSYLDLQQLQAYWSAERLNHHTAPTSLIYGLREALRLVHVEGLSEAWARHRRVGKMLSEGLMPLGLEVTGDPPYAIVHVVSEAGVRRRLLEEYGVHVNVVGHDTWRVGLLGADARDDTARRVLGAIEKVL
jgi:(S)-ureidoglycine-glyoxylate aminotransferase